MDNNNMENNVVEVVEAAPVAEAKAEPAIVAKAKGLFAKIIEAFKTNTKKAIIVAAAAVTALAVLIVGICLIVDAINNTYKAPIKTMEKYANKQSYYDSYEQLIDLSNGFCTSEMETIAKLYKSREEYKDGLEDDKDDFKDKIEELKEQYGSNYKIKYEITDKEKIDKDDLKSVRESLRSRAESLEKKVEETEDWDSDDWKEAADELGFDGDKSKAKKYYKTMEKIAKEYKTAKVSAGYELEVTVITKGRELDEPIENERTIKVYKIDGRWVVLSALF